MQQEELPVLTFDESAKLDILDFIDKGVDSEDFIVEKSNPSQRVLTFEGQEISKKEFGGVKRGSEVFIKDDIISLIRISRQQDGLA